VRKWNQISVLGVRADGLELGAMFKPRKPSVKTLTHRCRIQWATEGALAKAIKCNNLAFGRKWLDGVFVKHRADRLCSLRLPSALEGRTNENLAQVPGYL
jgi:hypothetical protein